MTDNNEITSVPDYLQKIKNHIDEKWTKKNIRKLKT